MKPELKNQMPKNSGHLFNSKPASEKANPIVPAEKNSPKSSVEPDSSNTNGSNLFNNKPQRTSFSGRLAAVRSGFPALLAKLRLENIMKNLEAVSLKTKIRIGLVMVFAGVTMIGILGGYYVQANSDENVKIMHENYSAIEDVNEVRRMVENIFWVVTAEGFAPSYKRVELQKAFAQIERIISVQLQRDIDEEERKTIQELERSYEGFKTSIWEAQNNEQLPFEINMQRLDILALLDRMREANDKIIVQRTQDLTRIADRVTLELIILGFVFFIFVFGAMIYVPNYLADPIQRMTESIRQIARKNYNQRLDIGYTDEFGEMAESFNEMAQKLAFYESVNVAQILTEKKRTETIVSRMNEAIIGLDNDKNILFANPPALDLLDLDQEETIGQSAEKLVKKNSLLRSILKEVLNDEVAKSASFPAVSIDKNGKRQYFNKDVLRVESQGEDAHSPTNVGYVIILKNVTELKEHDLAKTNFMATLSHELKTPISAIDMSVNLMEDKRVGNLNDEQKDLTSTIRQNTSRLLKMVNEILDISRIETGKLQLHFEKASPDEIVVKALDNVKTFIAEKHLEVFQYIEPDLPPIKMDLHKTTAVLVNFLTNAVRYSPENDSVEVVVVQQDGAVEFSVKDHGPGISEEEQKKLFQPYRRAKGDKTKGTGLGLAISKEFVEAQGGKIWVVSKPGAGSTFGFLLPVA